MSIVRWRAFLTSCLYVLCLYILLAESIVLLCSLHQVHKCCFNSYQCDFQYRVILFHARVYTQVPNCAHTVVTHTRTECRLVLESETGQWTRRVSIDVSSKDARPVLLWVTNTVSLGNVCTIWPCGDGADSLLCSLRTFGSKNDFCRNSDCLHASSVSSCQACWFQTQHGSLLLNMRFL